MFLLILAGLTSCYCGLFNQHAQVLKSCNSVENTQFEIEGVFTFKERVAPHIRIDSLTDTLKIDYFIGNHGGNVELSFYQTNVTLLLDTTKSSLNVRRPDDFFDKYLIVKEETTVDVHSFTPNTCCDDPDFGCYNEDYLKMPDSFIISLDGQVQLENVRRKFHMEIDMRILRSISEEC